MHADDPTKPRL